MSQDNRFVSVIVPHFQDLERLDLCLDALTRQSFPRERFEIVVADNASPVGIDAVASVIAGRARLVVVPEKGAGPTRNGGVAAATGEVLAFTDSDCLPDQGWLAAGVRALDTCDFAGGQVRVQVEDPQHMTPAEAFEFLFAFDNETYVRDRNFTVTANLFCTRDTFRKVGEFQAGLSEDIDWSHRAVRSGRRIGYAPDAIVWHPARRTAAELANKWKRINEERYKLYLSHRFGELKLISMALSQIPSTIYHTPRVFFDKSMGSLKDKFAVAGMMYKLRMTRCFSSLAMLLKAER